MKFVQIESGSK